MNIIIITHLVWKGDPCACVTRVVSERRGTSLCSHHRPPKGDPKKGIPTPNKNAKPVSTCAQAPPRAAAAPITYYTIVSFKHIHVNKIIWYDLCVLVV